MASSQSSLVVRALYRGLFRSARRFDQKPWLRTFLAHHPPFRRLVGGLPFFLGSDSCAATISRVFRERQDLPESTVSDALSEGFAVMKLLGTLTSRKRAPLEDITVHPASGSADVKGPGAFPEFPSSLAPALPFSPAYSTAPPEVDVEVVAADQLGVETEEVDEDEDGEFEYDDDGEVDPLFDATVRGTRGQGLGELLQQLPGNVMPVMIRGDAPPSAVSLSIDVEDALGETHTLDDLFVDPRVINDLMGTRVTHSSSRSKPDQMPSLFERIPSRGEPFPEGGERQAPVPEAEAESSEPVQDRLERVLGKFRAEYEAAVAKIGAVVGPDLLPWSVHPPVRGLLPSTALVPAAANLPISVEQEVRSEQQRQLFIQKMRSYFHRAVDEGNLEVVAKALRVLKPMDVSEDDCSRLLEECYEQDEPWLAVQILQIMQLNLYRLTLDALSAVTCAAANTGQLPAALTALRASSWGCLFGNINGNPDPLPRSPADSVVSEASFVPSQARLASEIELINHTIVAAARGPFADPELCFELFDALAAHNIRPNKESFESLSKALLLPRRPSPLDTYSTDIRLAEETFLSNRKTRAASLLKSMRSLGMRPTVSIYNAVLQSSQPDYEEVMRLLSRMARDRISPNSATVAICLRSAVASGKPQNVRSVLDRLQRARYASFGFGPTARGHDTVRNRRKRRGAASRPRT